jgi:hypothetical protein
MTIYKKAKKDEFYKLPLGHKRNMGIYIRPKMNIIFQPSFVLRCHHMYRRVLIDLP